MANKLLIFCGWTVAGINAASFLAMVAKFSPGLRLPGMLLLLAAALICGVIAFFAPSARPWIALIAVVGIVGGFAWLL